MLALIFGEGISCGVFWRVVCEVDGKDSSVVYVGSWDFWDLATAFYLDGISYMLYTCLPTLVVSVPFWFSNSNFLTFLSARI